MPIRFTRRRAFAVAAAVGAMGTTGIAFAGGTSISSVAHNDSGALALARASAAVPSQVLSAHFRVIPGGHSPAAIGRGASGSFVGFPRRGSTYGLLSSGCASLAPAPNGSRRTSCRDGKTLFRGTRDTTVLGVRLAVPSNATCLSVRFRFLSDEYPEFVGSEFNDAFIAELDRSTWHTASTAPRIRAPRNFAKTVNGRNISVNGAGVGRVSPAFSRGTTYDAGTRLLRASTPVSPGVHTLWLSIFDQGDNIYDSTVLLDGITVDRRSPCRRGVASDVQTGSPQFTG